MYTNALLMFARLSVRHMPYKYHEQQSADYAYCTQ